MILMFELLTIALLSMLLIAELGTDHGQRASLLSCLRKQQSFHRECITALRKIIGRMIATDAVMNKYRKGTPSMLAQPRS